MPRNRQMLRRATRAPHLAAEQVWTAQDHSFALRPFLTAMHRVHAQLGLPAATCLGLAPLEAPERARLAALQSDLGTASCAAPQALPSRDAAWGVLYALNGSAMGASVLAAQGARIGGHPSAYLALMQGYARSGALGAFFRTLDQARFDLGAACAGARSVFDAMAAQGCAKGDP